MKKKETIAMALFLSSFIVLNVIGYLFNIDILKTVSVKGNEFTYYFVSFYISLLTTFLYYIIAKLLKNK